MWTDILLAFWFFLPAGLANSAPVFAMHIPVLKKLSYPIDFYQSIGGKRIFGDHKTIRGFVVGIFVAILTVFVQQYLWVSSVSLQELIRVNYVTINAWVLGTLLGGGALLGDAIKSFFKRRVGIEPGKTWLPFDQIDYILGASVATYFYLPLSWQIYLIILVLWFTLHISSTFVGYKLGLKDQPL